MVVEVTRYPNAIAALESAGWSSEASTSVERLNLEQLTTAGFETWPTALSTLQKLGVFEIKSMRRGRVDRFWVDAAKASSMLDASWAEKYQVRVSSRLLPIGCAYNDHMVLLLAEDGRVFGSYDDFLALLGENVFAAIELFLTNGEVEEIA